MQWRQHKQQLVTFIILVCKITTLSPIDQFVILFWWSSLLSFTKKNITKHMQQGFPLFHFNVYQATPHNNNNKNTINKNNDSIASQHQSLWKTHQTVHSILTMSINSSFSLIFHSWLLLRVRSHTGHCDHSQVHPQTQTCPEHPAYCKMQ